MILYPEDRKLLVDAMVYMLKSAYTEQEIRDACSTKEEADELIDKRTGIVRHLIRLISLLKL